MTIISFEAKAETPHLSNSHGVSVTSSDGSSVVKIFRPGSALVQSRLLVENLLRSHGVDPGRHVLTDEEDSCSWMLPFSPHQMLVISVFQAGETGYIRVSSPLVKIPDGALESFYRRLLDFNAEMVTASLATIGEDVYVVALRPLKDLDPGEAVDLIGRVCIYAHQCRDRLSVEFNVEPWRP